MANLEHDVPHTPQTKFRIVSWPSGAGGMYSTTEDLYKWEQGLYTDAILSASSREMMFTPKVTVHTTADGQGYYHGYGGIICTHYDRQLLYHGGGIDGFSTRIARYPDEQVSIIVLTNIDPEIATPVVAIANDLAAIVFDQPYQLPKQRQTIDLDPSICHAYVGQYELNPGRVMIVTTESNRIFTQWAGQNRIELFPESSTKFFTKLIDSQCTFVVDETGKVTQVIVHQSGRERVANKVD